MAKNKRSRTSGFNLGADPKKGSLPSKKEINKTVAKVTTGEPIEEKVKRIPFTTALTPQNRAYLETASHEKKEAVADILNKAITHYFENIAPTHNKEMMTIFLKIYESKTK